MHISYYTIWAGLNPAVGFGYAGQNIVKSLQQLGHRVDYANAKAQLQLNFTQPHHYKLHKKQYQIGYTPWESTSMRPDWVERMNLCDEMWATSDWVADVYRNNGITKPIYVYPHGIEDIWKPKKRIITGKKIKFLHIGEPAARKDGQIVAEVFAEMFGNNPEYQLTIKSHGPHTIRLYNKSGQLLRPEDAYNNIKVIEEEYPIDRLVQLYHEHHVLVYPSWGEGFGFIPLQGLATGMPVISTYHWAQYKNYIGPLGLKSKVTNETLPKAIGDPHIGKMYKPDRQHLVDQMYDAVNDFKAYSGYYFAQSTRIHKEYNWIELTKNAFKHLEEKFS